MKVSEAAETYVQLKVPGGYHGPYKNSMAPYMKEPANNITSRKHKALIFVGPAQSSKTQSLIDNWIAYTIMCDPADMTIIQTSRDSARDFSRRRIDRMHRNCKELREKISGRKKDDNTFDKFYKTGQIITIGWPSINILSGKSIKYMALTDYDRMPQNVDGEGNPFDLSVKRTTIFGSGGTTVAESSPGFAILDSKWESKTLHEAPPSRGILALYNRGDRRRWYWPCPKCKDFFEPSFSLLKYDGDDVDLIAAADSVVMVCPCCSYEITPKHKTEMNKVGLWLADGQYVENGKVVGEGRKSDIASFWLKGPAAAFQTWKDLVLKFLQAEQEYEQTGEQEALKTTVNVDQGEPYLLRRNADEREPGELEARAEDLPKRVAPPWVRFIIANVDIQKTKFVVQAHGYGEGLENVLIDRFDISMSHRYDKSKSSLPINPAGYLEDWDLLIDKVIQKSYPVEDYGHELRVLLTVCDSGGAAGVTDNAYKFYRKLKKQKLSRRFVLVKGASTISAPRTKKVFPDSSKRKDRSAAAYGDIPVYMINTNLLKDGIDMDLSREVFGPGYIHFPNWLGTWFFNEMTAEERTAKGWINPAGARNEAFDLIVYSRAGCFILKANKIDWEKPPAWAAPFENNSMIVRETKQTEKNTTNRPTRKSGFVTGWK